MSALRRMVDFQVLFPSPLKYLLPSCNAISRFAAYLDDKRYTYIVHVQLLLICGCILLWVQVAGIDCGSDIDGHKLSITWTIIVVVVEWRDLKPLRTPKLVCLGFGGRGEDGLQVVLEEEQASVSSPFR